MRISPTAILTMLAVMSCGDSYRYVPVRTSNAVVSGTPAEDYPIPPSQGDVRLAVVGVEVVPLVGAPSGTSSLRLHMVVVNRSADTWTVDAREQRLALAGHPDIRAGIPAGVNSPGARFPVYDVYPGSKQDIELYFPLPPAVLRATTSRAFDVVWTVNTPGKTIEQRTAFERVLSVPAGESEEDVTGRWGGSSSPSR